MFTGRKEYKKDEANFVKEQKFEKLPKAWKEISQNVNSSVL